MASFADTILRVFGDGDDAERTLQKVGSGVEAFERVHAQATLDLEDFRVSKKLRSAQAKLAEFASTTVTADADVDTEAGRAELAALERQLNQIDRKRVSPEVNAKIAKAMLALQALDSRLKEIDHEKVTVDVDVRRGVAERALALQRAIGSLADEGGAASQSLTRLGGSAGGLGGSLSTAGGGASFFGISLVSLAAAAGALIPIIGSLVGALAALIGSLAAAAAAAGALAVALGAAMGPALGVVGATVLRVVGASKQHTEAQKAQAAASKQATTASKELSAQHEREYKATVAVRDAREGLTAATRRYKEAVSAAWKELREASHALLVAEREGSREAIAAQSQVKRSVRELAEARVKASKQEEDAIKASVDANRRLRDALVGVRDAYRDIRDAQLSQKESALSLLDAEDSLEGQQKTLRKSLEALGLSGEDLESVLATLAASDLSTLDIGALLTGTGIEVTPQQIENISDSARDLQRAQLGVTKATDDLSDATNGLSDANNGLADATSELAEAQKEVNDFVAKGLEAYEPYRDGLREVADAVQALSKAEKESGRITAAAQREVIKVGNELARLREKGVQENTQVVAAAEALRDAHQALAGAIHQTNKAMEDGQSLGAGAGGGGGAGGEEVEDIMGLDKEFIDVLSRVKDALKNAFKPATTAVLQGMVKGLRSIIPLIGELRPALTRVGEVIGGLAAKAGKALAGPEWTKALKFFARAAAPVTKLLGESFGSLAEILRNIAVASMPFLISGLHKVRDFLRGIAGSTDDTAKLRDNVGGLVEHLRSWLNLARAVGSAFTALFGGETAKAGKSMVDSLAKGSDSLAEWARSAKGQEAIKQFFEDTRPLVDALAELFGKLTKAALLFTEVMAPVLAPLVKGLSKFVDLVNLVLGGLTKVPAPIREAAGALTPFSSGLDKLKAAGDVLGGALDHLGAAFSGLGGIVSGAAKKALDGGKEMFEKVGDGISSAASWVVGAAGDVIEAVVSKVAGFYGKALSVGRTLFEKVKGGITAAFSAVVGAAGDVVSAIIGKVTGATERAFNAGENLFGKVKAGITAAFGAVVGAAGDIVNAVIGKITDAWERARSTAETLFEKAKAGITAARDAIVGAAGDVINAAVDRISNAAGAFYGAGVDIIKGLVNGIRSGLASVVDAISDTVNSAIDKGKDILGIGSPSKVFMRIGDDTMAGFAIGIQGGFDEVLGNLTAGLTAMVATPQAVLPAVAASGGSQTTTNNYDLRVESPAGEIADPRTALALLDTELRARGGLGT